MSKWFVGVVIVALLVSTGIGFWMYVEAKTELENTKIELDKLTELDKLNDIQAELKDTKVELNEIKAELDDTKVELNETNAKWLDTMNELNSAKSSLTEVTAELDQIKGVYPPRYFANLSELKDWFEEHVPVSGSSYDIYEKSLKIQQDALTDGFIWSVYYGKEGRIMGVVIVGYDIYYCYPEGTIELVGNRQFDLMP